MALSDSKNYTRRSLWGLINFTS